MGIVDIKHDDLHEYIITGIVDAYDAVKSYAINIYSDYESLTHDHFFGSTGSFKRWRWSLGDVINFSIKNDMDIEMDDLFAIKSHLMKKYDIPEEYLY